jgi:hypothetical protein
VLLRVAWYAERRPLWLDEAMLARSTTVVPLRVLVSQPLADAQVAPPAFLALERVAVVALGSGELALRLVPLVAAVVSVYLFLVVARRTLPSGAVPVAMALFAVNRALIAYGAEAKQYSTDVAVALGVWVLWLVVRERGTSWAGVVAVAAAGAAAVWLSHPAALVLVGLSGATLVLDRPLVRRRMSAAACVWGPSAVAAAWVAWHRVSPADRLYLDAFWSAGFPSHGLALLVWPLTATATVLGSLMRYPPGVVWLASSVVGLWIVAARRHQRALLLGVGPVLAALVAAAAGVYPFADRLALFLVPVCLLLTGMALWRHPIVATCVLVPQCIVALSPVQHEDMRTIAAAVAAHRQPGDAVYVYYGAAPSFAYYAQTHVSYDAGGCHRDDWRAYLPELDRYTGRRVWLVVGHSVQREDSLLTRYMGSARATLETITANDAFARLYAPDVGAASVAPPLARGSARRLVCRV